MNKLNCRFLNALSFVLGFYGVLFFIFLPTRSFSQEVLIAHIYDASSSSFQFGCIQDEISAVANISFCSISSTSGSNLSPGSCLDDLSQYDLVMIQGIYSSFNNAFMTELTTYLQSGGSVFFEVDPATSSAGPTLLIQQENNINVLLNSIGESSITLTESNYLSNNTTPVVNVGNVPYDCPVGEVKYSTGAIMTGAALSNATTVSLTPGVFQAYWDTPNGGRLGVATEYFSAGNENCDGTNPDSDDLVWGFMDPISPGCSLPSSPTCVGPNLLPNPSFENNSSCPIFLGEIAKVDDWDNGSLGTTDYWNCTLQPSPFNMTNGALPPASVPDGTGYVGMINGRVSGQPWKEYVATCLATPLESGQEYELTVDVWGEVGSLDFEAAIFGALTCPSAWPFTRGCPSSYTGLPGIIYDELSSDNFNLSSDAWTRISLSFVAAEDYSYISFGPGCTPISGESYYYIDQISLVETGGGTIEAGPENASITVGDNIQLQATASDGTPLSYSWTADPTDASLTMPDSQNPTVSPGVTTTYTVIADFGGGCTAEDQVTVTVNTPASCTGPNLIANPGFEIMTNCSIGNGLNPNIGDHVENWGRPGLGTPDIFHACNTGSTWTIGTNFHGNQTPRTGDGYGGFYAYISGTSREYLVTQFSSPLEAGVSYEIEFFVSLAEDRSNYAIDRLGLYFSDAEPVFPFGSFAESFGVLPQVETPEGVFFTDMDGWTQISLNYTAVGGEEYVTIGNFYHRPDEYLRLGDSNYPPTDYAYYYIDDVSIMGNNSNVDAGNDVTITSGNSTTLQATPSGGTPMSYSWSPSTGLSSSNIANPVAAPTSTTTYTVTADFAGCMVSDEVTVTVDPVAGCSGTNLVPNHSFESYTSSCPVPTGEDGVTRLVDWEKIENPAAPFLSRGTPDAFDACGLGYADVPRVSSGIPFNPMAAVGESYVGIITYDENTPDYREYITVSLSAPLTAGETYEINFKWRTRTYTKWATNRLGILFSNGTPNSFLGDNLIDATPQVEMPSGQPILDEWQWNVLSTTFTPSVNGLTDVTIGNFYNDAQTTITPTPSIYPSPDPFSFVFIDEVEIIQNNSSGTIDAGPDVTITAGTSTANLVATATGGTPVSYMWTPVTGLNDATIANPVASPTTTTTYTVTADFGGGCTAIDQVTVTVDNTACFLPTDPSDNSFSNILILSTEFNNFDCVQNVFPSYVNVDFCSLGVTGSNKSPNACLNNLDNYDLVMLQGLYSSFDSDFINELTQYIANGGSLFFEIDPASVLTQVQLQVEQEANLNALLAAIGQSNISLTTNYQVFDNITPTIGGSNLPYSCNIQNVSYQTGGILSGAGLNEASTVSIPAGVIQAYWETGFGGRLGLATEYFSSGNDLCNTVNLGSGDIIWNFMNRSTSNTCVPVPCINCNQTVDAGTDISIDDGENTQLQATSVGGTPISYSWSPVTGLDDATIANPIASPNSTTMYTVTADFGGGCTAEDQVTVTVSNTTCFLPADPSDNSFNNVLILTTILSDFECVQDAIPGYVNVDFCSLGSSGSNKSPNACLDNLSNYNLVMLQGVYSSFDSNFINELAQYITNGGSLFFEIDPATDNAPNPTQAQLEIEQEANLNALLSTIGQANVSLTTNYQFSDNVTPVLAGSNLPYSCAIQNISYRTGGILSGAGLDGASTVSIPLGVTQAFWETGFGGRLGLATEYFSAGNSFCNSIGPGAGDIIWNFMNRSTSNTCVPVPCTTCNQTINAGTDVSINDGENTQLQATPTGGTPISYSWSPVTGLDDATIANPIASPSVTTTYTVTADFGGGCTAEDQVTVTVNNTSTSCNGPNLVPNGDFETYKVCPQVTPLNGNVSDFAEEWFAPSRGTSDLFNRCGDYPANVNDTDVPINQQGDQEPQSGDGYGGFYLYSKLSPNNPYREYLSVALSQTLVAGTTYKVSFYLNLADSPFQSTVVIDQVGVWFSDFSPSYPSSSAHLGSLGASPQYTTSKGEFFEDTDNWMLVSFDYTATGSEAFITIGNFINDLSQVKGRDGSSPFIDSDGLPLGRAYYYLDNVSVSEQLSSNTIDAGPDQTINTGESASLIVTPTVGTPLSYTWTADPVDPSLTTPNSQDPSVSPAVTTTYTVTADFGGGCTATSSVLITVNSPSIPCEGVNLVPNPDFELFKQCPVKPTGAPETFVDFVEDWYLPSGSSDYFNSCGSNIGTSGVPDNFFGSQAPYNGEGYAGFYAYVKKLPNEREYLSVKLTEKLQANREYNVSFKTVLSKNSDWSVDQLGIAFTNEAFNITTGSLESNGIAVPLVSEAGVNLEDNINWTELSWTYTATGGEEYITIGNPANDGNVNLQPVVPIIPPSFPNDEAAYYYIDNVVISEKQANTVSAGDDISINQAESTQLQAVFTGDTPISYTWTANPTDPSLTDPNTQNPSVSPVQTTTYTIVADFVGGCTASDEITVTVSPPGCTLSVFEETMDNATATCNINDGQARITVGGATNFTVSWNDDQGNTVSVNDDMNPTNLAQGTYSVLVSDNDIAGCTQTIMITITEDCPNCAIAIDQINTTPASCHLGVDGQAMADIGGVMNINYLWQDADNVTISTSPQAENLAAGMYRLIVIDGDVATCSDTLAFVISQPDPLVLNTDSQDADCGLTNGSASVVVTGGVAPYTYSWSLEGEDVGASAPLIGNIGGGLYQVEVRDDNGCTVSETVGVVPLGGSTPVPDLGEDRTLCEGDTLLLDVGQQTADYLWQDGSTNPFYQVSEQGLYRVTVTNDCGTVTDDVFISVEICTDPPSFSIRIANTVTPNGDGDNDTFFIENIWQYPDNYLKVFNRWGNLIYETNGYNNQWEGTYQGKGVPTGTYYYILELGDADRQIFKGSVSVIY